ncbi:unnamed protein product [Moneuplotes crassus]|uniref:Uncharacterized protein n=1 Tax=Euplotes crassus TaxID=5936 RepID=A0AAD2D629_EUPCR|nr:unnamed protein product [Moneuplotes crassus]
MKYMHSTRIKFLIKTYCVRGQNLYIFLNFNCPVTRQKFQLMHKFNTKIPHKSSTLY